MNNPRVEIPLFLLTGPSNTLGESPAANTDKPDLWELFPFFITFNMLYSTTE